MIFANHCIKLEKQNENYNVHKLYCERISLNVHIKEQTWVKHQQTINQLKYTKHMKLILGFADGHTGHQHNVCVCVSANTTEFRPTLDLSAFWAPSSGTTTPSIYN